jgi:hypothetical protein
MTYRGPFRQSRGSIDTLWIQCAGIAVLIHWARASIERGVARLSSLHAGGLMIRFLILVIVLHFSQIFLWSLFLPLVLSSVVGVFVIVLLFSQQLFDGRRWWRRPAPSLAPARAR